MRTVLSECPLFSFLLPWYDYYIQYTCCISTSISDWTTFLSNSARCCCTCSSRRASFSWITSCRELSWKHKPQNKNKPTRLWSWQTHRLAFNIHQHIVCAMEFSDGKSYTSSWSNSIFTWCLYATTMCITTDKISDPRKQKCIEFNLQICRIIK